MGIFFKRHSGLEKYFDNITLATKGQRKFLSILKRAQVKLLYNYFMGENSTADFAFWPLNILKVVFILGIIIICWTFKPLQQNDHINEGKTIWTTFSVDETGPLSFDVPLSALWRQN